MTRVIKTAENWYTVVSQNGTTISDCHPRYGDAVAVAFQVDDIWFDQLTQIVEQQGNRAVERARVLELLKEVEELERRVGALVTN